MRSYISDHVLLGNHDLHGRNHIQKLRQERACLLPGVFSSDQSHAAADHIQGSKLNRIGFGTGHCNLWSCMGIKHVITFPCNGRAFYIDHSQNHRTASVRQPQSRKGINGLPGLGNNNHQRLFINQRFLIPKFRSNGHCYRNAQ